MKKGTHFKAIIGLKMRFQVNKKYHELLEDLDNNFRDAINELGNDEAQTLLSNRLKPIEIRNSKIFGWNYPEKLVNVKFKMITPPGGLEPPTFRLTAERASQLRHGGFLTIMLCFKTIRKQKHQLLWNIKREN